MGLRYESDFGRLCLIPQKYSMSLCNFISDKWQWYICKKHADYFVFETEISNGLYAKKYMQEPRICFLSNVLISVLE